LGTTEKDFFDSVCIVCYMYIAAVVKMLVTMYLCLCLY